MIAMTATASPCDGIDRSLSEARKTKLAPVIAKEEKVAKVKVLQSFRSDNWHIIYIENYVSDEPFLFYPGDPMTTKPISVWSGAATIYEEQEMKVWTLQNVPGIPENLASCFAWHVTMNRDQ
jgi:UTP-glucose-1-phosphate uridylyltransferase